ncbi:MAG TPA: CvpA family protein [Aggregatilineales bacterium]|nr:CvpA family protein [Aggregatilineales bacterium]
MIQLSTFLWMMIAMFAVVGFLRGWTKEIVATAGIILALFTLWQFQSILLQPMLAGAAPEQNFYLHISIFMLIVFFSYQTPSTAARMSEGRLWSSRREGLQERLLGLVIGAVNGYLIFGTFWYYLDSTGYPFPPFIIAPNPGSASAAMVGQLPLIFLVQGNFLTILVIVLFLFVIIAMI